MGPEFMRLSYLGARAILAWTNPINPRRDAVKTTLAHTSTGSAPMMDTMWRALIIAAFSPSGMATDTQ